MSDLLVLRLYLQEKYTCWIVWFRTVLNCWFCVQAANHNLGQTKACVCLGSGRPGDILSVWKYQPLPSPSPQAYGKCLW